MLKGTQGNRPGRRRWYMVYRDNHLLQLQISFAVVQRTENVDFVLCPNNLFCGMNGMYLAYISCWHVFLLHGRKWGSDNLHDLCTVYTFHFSRKYWFVPLLTSLHWVTMIYYWTPYQLGVGKQPAFGLKPCFPWIPLSSERLKWAKSCSVGEKAGT